MVTTFEQALQYLFSHIPKTEVRKFPGQQGLERMKAVMKELGSPQENYRTIHIAGTSGKGSTATLTSHLLAIQGFKVGLQLSPHLLDIRERVQIDNEFIQKEKFVTYLNEMIPAIKRVSSGEHGSITYFEILVALAYYSFWKESVEYAVIETGMGGLFDGTNVITREDKISVITKIGFDHMAVLGDTLEEIALQKAGIIQEKNTVFSTTQEDSVLKVLSHQSQLKNANLHIVQADEYSDVEVSSSGTQYRDNKRNTQVKISLIGAHQAENAQLAREVIFMLAERDGWNLNEEMMNSSLSSVRLPGRMDILKYKQTELVIDGAHNTQKMYAFLQALTQLYPNEKHVFLLAFKHGKDIQSMVETIEPLAKEIIVTDFWLDTQDMLNISEPADVVAGFVKNVPVSAITGTYAALEAAGVKDTRIIITGSLYFASEIYKLLNKKE